MTSISRFSSLFFAFVLAAQCDSVLSIVDPSAASLNLFAPTQSVSVEYPGDFLTLLFEASGAIATLPPSGPSDLYGFSFDVSFDPTQLQVLPNGVTETGYFAKNGVGLQPVVDNTTGSITGLNDFVAGPGPGENLSFTTPAVGADPLLSVTFKVIGSGTSYVSVPQNSNLFFSDSAGNFTSPILGTEEVISQPLNGGGAPGAPEPSTAQMLILAGSLLLLASRVLRKAVRPAKLSS